MIINDFLSQTLNNSIKGRLSWNIFEDIEVFGKNEENNDPQRLSASTIEELFKDNEYNLDKVKETSAKIMANMMLAQGATEETAMQSQLFAKDLSNAAGVPINLVMDDLANISDNVSAYLGSNPEKLVRATVEARRLGMSLETTAKVADSLLDFESSIEKIVRQALRVDMMMIAPFDATTTASSGDEFVFKF